MRTLEVKVLLGARQEQLVDAVLGNGRRRDRQDVLLDLARQPLQGQPHRMGVHLVQLVQDQLGHRDGLQVAVAAAPADVQDVRAGRFQPHGVRIDEQVFR